MISRFLSPNLTHQQLLLIHSNHQCVSCLNGSQLDESKRGVIKCRQNMPSPVQSARRRRTCERSIIKSRSTTHFRREDIRVISLANPSAVRLNESDLNSSRSLRKWYQVGARNERNNIFRERHHSSDWLVEKSI